MHSKKLSSSISIALFVWIAVGCGSESETQEPRVLDPIEKLAYGISCDPDSDVCVDGAECRALPGDSRIGPADWTCSQECDPLTDGAWGACDGRPCEVEFDRSLYGSVDGVGGGTCSNPTDGLTEGEECARAGECGEGLICDIYSAALTPRLLLKDGTDPFETCRRWCRPSTSDGGCTEDEICVDISFPRYDLDEYDLGICVVPFELGDECAENALPCRGGHCLVSDTESECRVACENLEPDCPEGEVCRRVPATLEDYVCRPR